MRTFGVGLMLAVVAATCAQRAAANPVTWNIVQAQSFVRLAIPDFTYSIDGLGDATIRIRNAGGAAWSDTGGRRAFLSGSIATDYVDKTLNPLTSGQIDFLDGAHNIQAVDAHNLRPNPAVFNPANTNASNPDGQYADGTTNAALFDFGAAIRSVLLITIDAGYLALDDVTFDILSGNLMLPGAGTTIPTGATNAGLAQAFAYVDGLAVLSSQPIPDMLNESLGAINGVNSAGGTITNLGGFARRLTYTLNVAIPLDVGGITVPVTATGQIVADAIVPEPSSLVLLAGGGVGLLLAARRRRRRHLGQRQGMRARGTIAKVIAA